MLKKERIQKILELFEKEKILKTANVLSFFDNKIERTTIYRDLKELIKEKKIKEISKWKYEFKINPIKYLWQAYFEREVRKYNFDFLKNYIPNKTSFLWESYKKIEKEYENFNKLTTYDYLKNIRWIENLLIDLSYASSKLEWNTYSYLDTEVLVKYNEKAEWKTKEETQMILNHKNIIKYLVDFRKELNFENKTFFEIHQILWKWLLFEDYLWKIRDSEVKIGGSTYIPLDDTFVLKGEFELFLKKLNQIKNPFEQSLFILIFIPYFQIFMDINKRTSRISANIPLIKNWLAPISLLQVKERDYILAILAIYELNDTSLMRDIFVNNYLLNLKRYI